MISIDLEKGLVARDSGDATETYSIDSPEGYAIISEIWLRSGWGNKHVYTFTWMGRPIIQLPEDLIRIQEVIYSVKPDVIVETGIAHGGSLVFYASVCKAMGSGRVIGIDIEIRPHNRKAIESHELYPYLTLIEGSSIEEDVVENVKSQIKHGEKVIVFLDSNHSKQHVLAELKAYASLVSKGSYIVAMDGIMEKVAGAPRTQPDWSWNNPRQAALEFVKSNPGFVIEEPATIFNEGNVHRVTYWPDAFIKRVG